MPIQNGRERQPHRAFSPEGGLLASKIIYLNLDGLLPAKAKAAAQIIDQLPTRQAFKARDEIQLPSPHWAIFIEQGAVDILTNASDEIPSRRLGPGYVFGDMPQLGMETSGARIVAAEDCGTVFLDQDTLQRIVHKSLPIALRVIEMLLRRLPDPDSDRVIPGFGITDSRLIRLLPKLADENGELDGVSERDLGRWLGLSRQAVSRALGRLRQRGLVEKSRMRIKLLNLDKFTDPEGENI
jgi:CRP/FNR family transcriptional regulator, cyclic AMP receptor protein